MVNTRNRKIKVIAISKPSSTSRKSKAKTSARKKSKKPKKREQKASWKKSQDTNFHAKIAEEMPSSGVTTRNKSKSQVKVAPSDTNISSNHETANQEEIKDFTESHEKLMITSSKTSKISRKTSNRKKCKVEESQASKIPSSRSGKKLGNRNFKSSAKQTVKRQKCNQESKKPNKPNKLAKNSKNRKIPKKTRKREIEDSDMVQRFSPVKTRRNTKKTTQPPRSKQPHRVVPEPNHSTKIKACRKLQFDNCTSQSKSNISEDRRHSRRGTRSRACSRKSSRLPSAHREKKYQSLKGTPCKSTRKAKRGNRVQKNSRLSSIGESEISGGNDFDIEISEAEMGLSMVDSQKHNLINISENEIRDVMSDKSEFEKYWKQIKRDNHNGYIKLESLVSESLLLSNKISQSENSLRRRSNVQSEIHPKSEEIQEHNKRDIKDSQYSEIDDMSSSQCNIEELQSLDAVLKDHPSVGSSKQRPRKYFRNQEMKSSSIRSWRKSSNSISSASPIKHNKKELEIVQRPIKLVELSSLRNDKNSSMNGLNSLIDEPHSSRNCENHVKDESMSNYSYDNQDCQEIVEELIKKTGVKQSSLKRLEPGEDIDDLIINFYIEYLCWYHQNNKKFTENVSVMNTYFYSTLLAKDKFNAFANLTKKQNEKLRKPIVIFPIHFKNDKFKHWAVACMVRDVDIGDGYNQALLFLDSYEPGLSKDDKQQIFFKLKFVGDQSRMVFREVKVPQQQNGNDCGLFMLRSIRSIIEKPEITKKAALDQNMTKELEKCKLSRNDLLNLITINGPLDD
ncbi:unnamed protein product [Moneuplotes crassus]|uniref:Ubiquitin-like protease family profile domain-containing protein n=1 Tax=Euplotes crassus TaxID=5936 RepID=A0AAD1UI43_EUPCR|nr:unnamed protein product [Moneuplotes crassus]